MGEPVRISAGLDLGSSKISLALMQKESGQLPQLLAFSQTPCRYLKNGMVVHLDALKSGINTVVSQINSLTDLKISQVIVNLPPGNVRFGSSDVSIDLKKRKEITEKEIHLLHAQLMENNPEGWELVHILPEEYRLDGQEGILNPLGMAGQRLDAAIQTVWAPLQTIHNLNHSLNKCRCHPTRFVLDILADAESLLTPDERELGVCLINIGGAYTQMLAVKSNHLELMPCLNLGSDQITSDIAIGIRTPIREAEKLKIKYGAAVPHKTESNMKIEIPSLGGSTSKRMITQNVLVDIIRPRVEEIFELIVETFRKKLQSESYSAGILLTGAGSLLPGIHELAEKHFSLPVMPGKLRELTGVTDLAPDTAMSTAVGLGLYGLRYPETQLEKMHSKKSLTMCLKSLLHWFGGGN